MQAHTGRLPALLAFALLAQACGADGRQPAAPPPNLILISLDMLRADHLGSYGYARETSPALDRFAASGVLFEQVQSPAVWTLPAHASLFTGRYPRSHAVTHSDSRFDADQPTLAGELRAAGYATGAILNVDFLERIDDGFETLSYFEPVSRSRGAAGSIHRAALDWIERAERPYFLFVHHYDLHTDFRPHSTYRRLFAGPYDGPVDGTTRQLKQVRAGKLALDADDARHLADLYDAEIRQFDATFDAFLAEFDRRFAAQPTYLAIVSDHGEEFLEHGDVLHGRTLHQELVRVPWLLRGPGLPAGLRIREPVSLIDVAPTLLGLLGQSTLAGAEGSDLSAALRSGADWPERALLSEADEWMGRRAGERKRALRRGDWVLHRDGGGVPDRLFHLARDPLEQKDLAAAEPQQRARLARELDALPEKPERRGRRIELDAEARARLRALGYLE